MKISTLGHHAEILGAAALVMENYDVLENNSKTVTENTGLSNGPNDIVTAY